MAVRHDLRNIPFFSDLEDRVLEAIARRLQREHYHKGATVFAEDEPGDCMYLIESGQIKVLSDRNGREKILSYLGPGNFFGEMALLLGDKRSATARVVIDADLLVLRKQDLEELLDQHPTIAVMMTRELGRRLERKNQLPEEREENNLVAAIGSDAPTLARYLAQLTGEEVCMLDLGGLANMTLDTASLSQANVLLYNDPNPLEPETLASRLSNLVELFYWVILCVAPYETPLTLKAVELADVTVQIGAKEHAWTRHLASKAFWRIEADDRAIRRLARRIAQKLVGLALSSGNSRGIAHIGVLKVLHEAGIPIDMIAGTSAGAILGALYAAGRTIEEMSRFAAYVQKQSSFPSGIPFWDPNVLQFSGLLRGNKVLEYLRKWLLNKTFDELNIPMVVVATDLISGEEVVFDRGQVAEAVRASMSVMGVFEPAQVAGRYLIDGGSVNPVPTQLLVDRGMNIILASNVIPSLEDRIHRRELKREGKLPTVMGILFGAIEIMESEIIKSRLGPVDVLIQPDLARYNTSEWDKAYEMIQRGEEAAHAQLPSIRQLLEPHPRKPLH